MLLAGAGLMIRSFVKLQNHDLGFRADNVLTAQVFLPGNRYPLAPGLFGPEKPGVTPELSKGAAFYSQLMESLKNTAGIESIGAVSSLPLNPVGIDYDLPVIVQGRPRPRAGEEPQADFRFATPDYFQTMRIPLKSGRLFTDFDGHDSAPVIVINETMATQMFPGEDPLGQRRGLRQSPHCDVNRTTAVFPEQSISSRQKRFAKAVQTKSGPEEPPLFLTVHFLIWNYCCEEVALLLAAICLLIASIVLVARNSTIFFASSVFFLRSAMFTPLIDALPAFTRAS